ncbi:MAG: M14 family zinc carboxypeptidase [Ornithinimicrobium sp.]
MSAISAPSMKHRVGAFVLTVAVCCAPAVSIGPAFASPVSSASPVGAAPTATHRTQDAAYPRTTDLREPDANDNDAAEAIGLTPFHRIAPALNEAQQSSDRVSVEVVGRSAEGRDLYLVTLTAPENGAPSPPKVPVLINTNLHGDEWEGTDAALELVQDYATSQDPAIEATLGRTRVHIVICANPDGRVAGTRDNAAGFDLNRDLLTASQPESRAVRDTIVSLAPAMVLDVHGYANGTLIEPTTAPFGQNIEFDLAMRHALPNALGIERAINDLGYDTDDEVRPPQIPLRDWARGWDGWAPVFTAQYATLQGATGQTVELPLAVNNGSYTLPPKELRRRTGINRQVARAAMDATVTYAGSHRSSLIADREEAERRAQRGEPGRAAPWGKAAPSPELIDGSNPQSEVDVERFTYPQAYVIPSGAQQRSVPSATRLVRALSAHGVTVEIATDPVRLDGTTFPAGSYVVDMRQPRRGVADALLSSGADASPLADSMYDISAWSLGALWGADVITIPPAGTVDRTAPASTVRWALPPLEPLTADDLAPAPLPRGPGPWRLRLQDPGAVAALNALLEDSVALRYLPKSGSVIVPADARSQVEDVTEAFGIPMQPAGASPDGLPMTRIRVAAATRDDETFALQEMGFTVTPISAEVMNEGFDYSAIDTLMVSADLNVADLTPRAREDLVDFFAAGGGLVARGRAGLQFNEALDLLPALPHSGRGDANGVVTVTSSPTGLAAGASAETFVNRPYWFTDLGEGVIVDQRYADADPLVSGHWRTSAGAGDGPREASGQALLVHGTDPDGPTQGAAVVLFGSDPLFRAHPKGQYALVAQALLWTSTKP